MNKKRKWTLWSAMVLCLLMANHINAKNILSIPDVVVDQGGMVKLKGLM